MSGRCLPQSATALSPPNLRIPGSGKNVRIPDLDGPTMITTYYGLPSINKPRAESLAKLLGCVRHVAGKGGC